MTTFVFSSLGSRTSSAVLKPVTFCAPERSTDTTLACGYGDRMMRPYSMPGRVTSKVYFARPLTLSGPSSRLTRVPTTVLGVDVQLYFGSTGGACGAPPRPPCRRLATRHPLYARDCLEDARERAAAADVAVETFPDLFRRRIRMLLEQTHARHDEAGRAEAAHQRVLVAEGL